MAERTVQRASDTRDSIFQINRPSPSMDVDQRIEYLATEINRTLALMSTTIGDLKSRIEKLEKASKK